MGTKLIDRIKISVYLQHIYKDLVAAPFTNNKRWLMPQVKVGVAGSRARKEKLRRIRHQGRHRIISVMI